MSNGYPIGAGPTAGRFIGEPWSGQQAPGAAGGSPRPFARSQRATLVNGRLRASFGEPRAGQVWWVSRITVQADSPVRAYVYVGAVIPDNAVSGTGSGSFDENDPNQPYLVPEGSPLTVEWLTGVGTAIARIEYVEV